MDILTYNDFKLKEGAPFQILLPDGITLDVVLTRIDLRKSADYVGKVRDAFSLIFEGTRGVRCPESMYRLRDVGGRIYDIYLVAVGRNEDYTYRYQAVFN